MKYKDISTLPGYGRLRAVSLFFRFYVKGVCARDARPEKKKETTASLFWCLSRLAPSVTLGRLRVSRVLLDEPRKKRDCS